MNKFMNIEPRDQKNIVRLILIAGAVLTLLFAVKLINEIDRVGDDANEVPSTISVSGTGEAFAVPDVAKVSFTVRSSKPSISEAQKDMNTKTSAALESIKSFAIAEKDIKTVDYSAYPEYDNPSYVCYNFSCPPPKAAKIVGYAASQRVEITIRDTEKAGDIIDALGKDNVTEISGPDFSISDEKGIEQEARAKAIADAKEQAKVLAKDLGVRLGDIVSFSEDGGGYPMPYMMKAESAAMDSAGNARAVLPVGENKITRSVTITFEVEQ
jgi:uncharacterized protein